MTDFEHAKRAFRAYYDANIGILREAEESLRTQIRDVLADRPSFATPHVVSRIKSREECINKFQRKYLPRLAEATDYAIENYVADLVGVRVICLHVPDIKEIARLLEAEFDVLDVSDKAREVEKTADTFRYKGLHLEMALSDRRRSLPAYSQFASLRFEVQVRTAIQDAWSTLDHAIKYKRRVPHELTRRINALAALFEIADHEFLAIKNQLADIARGAPAGAAAAEHGRGRAGIDVLPVLRRRFPRFGFDDQRLRAFVDELQSCGPPLSPAELEAGLTAERDLLVEYARHQWAGYRNAMNPLTLVRHAIYLRDPAAYRSILSDEQRDRFERWRQDGARRSRDESLVWPSPASDGPDLDWLPE
jgi:putative GTP pyrophosphokinase